MLSTILEKLGHNRIDILKMDIEGAEYEVIEDIISSTVPIQQVLIEFHHRFSSLRKRSHLIPTLDDNIPGN